MRHLHCGDVLAREGVGSVADEQACFTHSPGIRNERKKVIWEIMDTNAWNVVYSTIFCKTLKGEII